MRASLLVAGAVLAASIVPAAREPAVLEPAAQWDAGAGPERRVELRVYLRTPLEGSVVGGMLREAARVWRPYGVILQDYLAADDVQSRPLAERVRVVIEPETALRDAPRARSGALGWIEFLEPGLPRDVVHVSAARAARMMSSATWAGSPLANRTLEVRRWALSRALGRALAHELGHYLLRSTGHSARGLMREEFRPDELVDNRLDRFGLLPDQHARLAEIGLAVQMARR